LQIDSIWMDCYTDADIQEAIDNLPKDLEDTYARCLEKIHKNDSRKPFSLKILRWVLATPRPFKIDELREAAAIDPNTGLLDRNRMPLMQDIFQFCANLITKDDNGHVLPVHHSLLQFLLSRKINRQTLPNFSIDTGRLELGELCVAHLASPYYGLALQLSDKGTESVFSLETNTVTALTRIIPSAIGLFLPEPKPVRLRLPIQAANNSSTKYLPPFFYFAREQWAPLTREINRRSSKWEKFCNLALEQNTSWRLHPWAPLGQSFESHYFGLLGYAIANRHVPLLELLMTSRSLNTKKNIFNLPFACYDNLSATHLAARTGDMRIFSLLLDRCDLRITDHNGRTALHHAAGTGSLDIVALLLRKKLKPAILDNRGLTALDIAAENGHESVVRSLLDRADIHFKNGHREPALHLAAENGHGSVVRSLLDRADINAKEYQETALQLAAENGHESVVRLLLDRADINAKEYHETALRIAAENGHESIVRLLESWNHKRRGVQRKK
jgi:ankyrin repeat protein